MDKRKFVEGIEEFIGQKIAVICVRYQYRGVLTEVGTDYIAIGQSTAVEVSGPCQSERPTTEDIIGGTIFIKTDAIELFYRPGWVEAPLPGEQPAQAQS